MARKRKGRVVDGILLLEKPTGISSNSALQQARRLYNAQKAGHTGSLDPLASGMLPVCFGEATKFSQYLLNSDKAYRVTAKMGETTTTADAEGEVLKTRPVNVTPAQLSEVVHSFAGDSMQVPSMFSALKHNGQPLYKLARQGIEVERKARPITIYKIEIENFSDTHFDLYVECSKGTYIRNLVEDIGEKLGCGAHVTRLHREWVAHFDVGSCVSLEHLENLKNEQAFEQMDDLLLPIDEALHGYPCVSLDLNSAAYFLNGQAVTAGQLPSGLLKVYDESHRFLGVGESNEDHQLAPRRLIANH